MYIFFQFPLFGKHVKHKTGAGGHVHQNKELVSEYYLKIKWNLFYNKKLAEKFLMYFSYI